MNAYLTRHLVDGSPRWAADGKLLDAGFTLAELLSLPASGLAGRMTGAASPDPAGAAVLAPIEALHEVWACGVTYLRSRAAREAESTVSDVYSRVYDAARPETFFKAQGWRVAGHGAPIRVRNDSKWSVPEPELTLVVNSGGEIVGYTVGNDVSARDIEGENPLYLPQAKVYDASCALGPGIVLAPVDEIRRMAIEMRIERGGTVVFEGETSLSQMKRTPEELASYVVRELAFPHGVFVMTGAGIIPPDAFTLRTGDRVRITIGPLVLENPVQQARTAT